MLVNNCLCLYKLNALAIAEVLYLDRQFVLSEFSTIRVRVYSIEEIITILHLGSDSRKEFEDGNLRSVVGPSK